MNTAFSPRALSAASVARVTLPSAMDASRTRREIGGPVAEARDRQRDALRRRRVRQAEMPVAAASETGARERGHAVPLEERIGRLVHREAAALEQRRDVGERVERGNRLGDAYAVDRREPADERVACAA